jgi:glycosyltransferase 2 family protein
MNKPKPNLGGKQWFSLLVGAAITAALLTWVVRDVDWRAVGESLARSHWGWFGVGWVAYLITYVIRAVRWGTLLNTQHYGSTFGQRHTAIYIGFGANSVLPAALGEVLRAGLLGRQAGVPFEASLGSIFAERMLDIGVVLLFLILPLMLQAVPAVPGFSVVLILALATVLLLLWGLCLLGARHPAQTVARLSPLWGRLRHSRLQQRLQVGVLHFLQGLSALSQPQRLLILFLQTLLIWLLNGVTYWTGLLAIQEWVPGYLGALFIQSGTALAIAIPSTPGYLGPFEASLQVLLGLYQIPAETILSYAIALRFLMYITIPIIAAGLVIQMGLPAVLGAYRTARITEKP